MVLNDISANLRDPELNAAKVGARLGLTPRYVQLLMEGFGKSFSEHVRESRLDEARRMLRDSTLDHLRITDIAYAVGFQDISYFNRAFRHCYGERHRPSAAAAEKTTATGKRIWRISMTLTALFSAC